MNRQGDDVGSSGARSSGARSSGAGGRVALGWALVGVPLAYGVVETLVRISKLFAS